MVYHEPLFNFMNLNYQILNTPGQIDIFDQILDFLEVDTLNLNIVILCIFL